MIEVRFFSQLNPCGHSPYVTFSLRRGWVYNCCWSSPAQSFSGPSPAGLMTIFYCLRFGTSPTWMARSPYLYPPGTGWHYYTPRQWVGTRRATVGVFEPASAWLHGSQQGLGSQVSMHGFFNNSNCSYRTSVASCSQNQMITTDSHRQQNAQLLNVSVDGMPACSYH
jgi:hypothetical protein